MDSLNNKSLITLLNIKHEKNLNQKRFILKKDVMKHGLLILSKNKELTSELIDKLLCFGVEEVYADIKKDESAKEALLKVYKRYFFKNEKILVIDKDFQSISLIIKKLMNAGFNQSNIFATNDKCLIKRYLDKYDINTIFADKKMCLDNLELLDRKIVFITNAKGEYLNIKINKKPNFYFISKEVSVEFLNKIFNQVLENNFKQSNRTSNRIKNLQIIA